MIRHRISLVFCVAGCLAASPAIASDGVAKAGDILRWMLPATGLGMTFYYDDAEGRPQFYKSFLAANGTSALLKATVHDSRPNGESHGFPSGHAATAFQGASFIQLRYGWTYGLPAYALATFVGYSRVEAHEHFAYQVLAGAAIGIAGSYLFTHPLNENTTVSAFSDGHSTGVSLNYQW